MILLFGVINMTYDYHKLLEDGLEFQDYVADKLYERGIILLNFVSRKHSLVAENKFGMEIKLDKQFRKTGNLYIETAERINGDLAYLKSGIYREDNSWLWLIGDMQTFWIIAKKHLLKFEKNCRKVETETSRGFLFPVKRADEWCVLKLEF